jgi:MFS family permease
MTATPALRPDGRWLWPRHVPLGPFVGLSICTRVGLSSQAGAYSIPSGAVTTSRPVGHKIRTAMRAFTSRFSVVFAAGPLWRHSEFLKLWAGQTVSLVGTAVTSLALPLTAVLVLGATPAQMGLLGAFQWLPVLIIGLVSGAWVDRRRRKPVLLSTDLALALVIGSVPVAAALGLLGMEWLYVVAFCSTALSFTAGLAGTAFLPRLVGREHLVEANAKLSLSNSVALVIGPSIAGVLVLFATAPMALTIDAASYILSALAVAWLRTEEPRTEKTAPLVPMWGQIREGFAFVVTDPVLRAMQLTASFGNMFTGVATAVYVLFASAELGVSAGTLGLIYACGSVGGLIGALAVGPCTRRFGIGRTMMGISVVYGVAGVLVPLASGPQWLVLAVLLTARFLNGIGNPVFNVTVISLRQASTPDHLQGRVNASARFISTGLIPAGALLGGFLGETVGLRPTLWVAGVGVLLAGGFIWTSPVRSLQQGGSSS